MFPKKKGKYDIVHGFSAAPIMALRTAYLKHKLKAWKSVHSIKSETRSIIGRLNFLNLVDNVTVPTNYLRNNVFKNATILKSNINLKKFKPKKLKKDIDVLYFGATWDDKGVEELCEALQQFDGNAVIISRNPIPDELNHYLYLNNIQRIVGSIQNLEDYINRAKVVVLPYKTLKGTENTPSCLLEAVACKVPVITSKMPEIRELFDNSEILQVGTNPNYLLSAIKSTLECYGSAKKRAEKAFKKIRKFSTKEVVDHLDYIYKDLS